MMGNLISPYRPTFILGRAMMDGVLAINEIINFVGRNKSECMLVKLDFATTYYCISWDYLRYTLGRMNFCYRWLRWM